MSGKLGLKDTWHLLRYLLDPENCKTAHNKNIGRIIHEHPFQDDEFLNELRSRYLDASDKKTLPEYKGALNPGMDEEITTAEVFPYKATAKTLTINKLTAYVNQTNRFIRLIANKHFGMKEAV
ncbi:hypothetical protein HPB49_007229 [Dermacentor silvarum]|uniref:Uncharacterized protein n=1 Tax=Dermacentor silvarum TaxID=543639 RepID=A0ACB8DXR4_DERSI|nr:hypothetical protein HPB49_007229 [Dermacentor silvarum]